MRPSGEPACVVHRDVSPQNLFVTWSGVGKVMDFGVAKAAGSSKTDTGVLKGKPAYMPPEQFRGQPPSPGFDIWALGVCLWEAVAGCRLFVGDDPAAIMMQVLTGPIGKASSVSGSSARFDDAIAHALQRDPAKRLLTARAFAQAVSEAVPASRSLHDEDVAEWLEAIFPGDRLLDQQKLADALRGERGPGAPPLDVHTPTTKVAAVTFSEEPLFTPRPTSGLSSSALDGLPAPVLPAAAVVAPTIPAESGSSASVVLSIEVLPSTDASVGLVPELTASRAVARQPEAVPANAALSDVVLPAAPPHRASVARAPVVAVAALAVASTVAIVLLKMGPTSSVEPAGVEHAVVSQAPDAGVAPPAPTPATTKTPSAVSASDDDGPEAPRDAGPPPEPVATVPSTLRRKPPAKPVGAPFQPPPGRLTVKGSGGVVVVDGVERGAPPLFLELPVGTHTVTLRVKGAPDVVKSVPIRAGAQSVLQFERRDER